MSIFKPQIILFDSPNVRKRSNSGKNLYTREEALIYVPSDYGFAFLNADFTLISVQHMLDAVSSAHTLLIALSYLELS